MLINSQEGARRIYVDISEDNVRTPLQFRRRWAFYNLHLSWIFFLSWNYCFLCYFWTSILFFSKHYDYVIRLEFLCLNIHSRLWSGFLMQLGHLCFEYPGYGFFHLPSIFIDSKNKTHLKNKQPEKQHKQLQIKLVWKDI